ncbi:uncharacterized protein N7469_001115 [Penicillium citrinum]|uniref:Uncharacterized protein n=1 Tax=Penicillium citrinum TaxID=5077 RepID=A0A9W9PGX6_PENCI|nr:uncharacterized protein N7469_001115 [Penicillium citrinum]KAJ5242788.1 hypothetical protein N7469_001115 [Penicillium citrinum]KAK5806585.1 hypothetical protein VI817_000843 [Penicillium citrinum]
MRVLAPNVRMFNRLLRIADGFRARLAYRPARSVRTWPHWNSPLFASSSGRMNPFLVASKIAHRVNETDCLSKMKRLAKLGSVSKPCPQICFSSINRYTPTNNSNGAKKTKNNKKRKFMASVEEQPDKPSNTRESTRRR